MQKNNPFFDDLAKMATGAASTMLEMRHEVEHIVQTQFDKMANKMNFVTREEFEVVREMAQKAREENEVLRQELATLTPKKSSAKQATKSPKTAKISRTAKTSQTAKAAKAAKK